MQQRKITFIGAGNMASAIVGGLVSNGYPASLISVCAPSSTQRDQLSQQFGITSSHDNLHCAKAADVIILAVKPQIMAEVCQALREHIDFSHKLVLSLAAGITSLRLSQLLGEDLRLIRIMANTPSLIGKGMSGLFAPSQICQEDRHFTAALMSTVGEICWVEQESDINGIIAAAGSAPAYFLLLIEAMQQEAERQGFDPGTARRLVQQSALGTAAMVIANPSVALTTLREQITSEGGTTAEALRVFHQHHFSDIVSQAMQAAVTRAQEMETLF